MIEFLLSSAIIQFVYLIYQHSLIKLLRIEIDEMKKRES